MNKNEIIIELAKVLPEKIIKDLVNDFLDLRQEVVQGILGKISAGKFIESTVQLLQFLEIGKYDPKPKVDAYLIQLESKKIPLDDGLRLCIPRVARAVYTIRNKRDIAHKGSIRKNQYDLRFIYNACQWILTEIVRQTVKPHDMVAAGKIIDLIQKPISHITEEFGDRKIVYGKYSVKEEILILLDEAFPEFLSQEYINRSLDRRSTSAIINALKNLWKNKFIHQDSSDHHMYKITRLGLQKIAEIVKKNC